MEEKPLVCVEDFELLAQSKLAPAAFEFFRGGADDETTLQRNVEAFKNLLIRPRILVDVSKRDTSVALLNGALKLKSPICIAPTACHKVVHVDGELATVKAASDTGALMIVSSAATCTVEEIARAAPESLLWFQLYVLRERTATINLIRRAEKAGYKALVVTVDSPVLAIRRNNLRNDFKLIKPMKWANLVQENDYSDSTSYTGSTHSQLIDDSMTWATIDWIKSFAKLPIILKGILTAEDALEACCHGVSGIIVSNHGGRQLDSVPATIEVLPEIVKAVGDKCEVYFDGGIRTGTSIFKALALGAKAVFIGRPIIWGLACEGQAGVSRVLDILNEELSTTMALAGCKNLLEIKNAEKLVIQDSIFGKSKL